MQILLTSGLLIALSAYLLHQFLTRSLSDDDLLPHISSIEPDLSSEERLKAA